MLIIKVLYIAVGGAIGATLRYGLSGLMHRFLSSDFPWGTLTVNLVGSLGIGLLWGLSENILIPQNLRLFLIIGLLGSFTTFSAFSLENFHLVRDGEYLFSLANILLNVFLGITLVYVGFFIMRYYSSLVK